nr:alpha-L-fucosidase [Blastocystis sp.]
MKNLLFILLFVAVLSKRDLPYPTEEQAQWLERGIAGFIHFGVNTYTGKEWGDGTEDPKIFNPVKLNTTQWIEAFRSIGAEEVILVAKHHDGFMLFPSAYSNHTVAYSTWRDGKGDVVREFVQSCRALGTKASLYLSPWDRFFYNMTWRPEYNEYYSHTLEELTTRYGPIYELWWDGANAQQHMTHLYDWQGWYKIIKRNQPQCLGGGCGGDEAGIFDCGPDTAWGQTESGLGKEENWNFHTPSVEFPGKELVFSPLFLDVSIRPGWFYHANESPKTLKELVHIYFRSVGLNYQLQLNVPPTPEGLFDPRDVAVMKEFGAYIEEVFAHDEARKAVDAVASSFTPGYPAINVVGDDKFIYWTPAQGEASGYIELVFEEPVHFNVVMMQEFIRHGQRVSHYSVAVKEGDQWVEVAKGTTIGVKKMNVLDGTFYTDRVRVTIEDTWEDYPPEITRIGLFNSELY